MQLTKGVYGTEFHPSGDNTFGLRCGQMRSKNQLTHNGGWYNGLGEKLGFGDLSADDMLRIFTEIEPGEVFIVLSESDSFWNFVTRPGLIGSMSAVKADAQAPGVDYVVEKAMYAITNWGVFVLMRHSFGEDTITLRGLGSVPVINRDRLREMVSFQKV